MWQDGPPPIAQPPPASLAPSVHYGGPDRPPRMLRDLLKSRIETAPPGSEIVWTTYYFRDRDLAQALVDAHRRGVVVRVLLEARPRRATANEAVIAQLRELGTGLRLHRTWLPGPRLHAKIYAFSGPAPEVLIGSFNPSGDEPEDPEVVAEIGDQDRGHNLLVAFREPASAQALLARARRLWESGGLSRFDPAQNQPVRLRNATLFFFPRLRPGIVERSLQDLEPGDRVRAAVSHLDQSAFSRQLAQAATRGIEVELVVHDTARRAPDRVVAELAGSGVTIRRYCDPRGLPMHAKFLIVDHKGGRSAWFGSLNYNLNSRWLNQEILAHSSEGALVASLEARFQSIAAEAERFGDCEGRLRVATPATEWRAGRP